MVEEAETHRADVQRLADRVAGWYLPVVVALAALTFLVSRNLSADGCVSPDKTDNHDMEQ